ncbi:unnamed protein product, partial [Didymodactylos carnosus]
NGSEIHELFVATDEWQPVKPGQQIPSGLHVRLDLQTGSREAKLLERDDNKAQQRSNNTQNDQDQKKFNHKEIREALSGINFTSDDVVKDENHDDIIRKKFRPYEELKKDFEEINMRIQTDQEILAELIEKLKKMSNDNDEENEHKKTILTDLEYYLHQYDNALTFSDLGGLTLVHKLFNSTNSDIRALTCLVLGAAWQGNPKVQIKAVEQGFIQSLLRLLSIEPIFTVKLRVIYALSTLLRHFPYAQIKFVKFGGIQSIINVVTQETNDSNKLRMRAISLMNDLITEKDLILSEKNDSQQREKVDQYNKIKLREQLIARGWCSVIGNHLNSNEHDIIEKTLLSMKTLISSCRKDFKSHLTPLNKLMIKYTDLQRDDIDTDGYFTKILDLLQTLTVDLYSDEL